MIVAKRLSLEVVLTSLFVVALFAAASFPSLDRHIEISRWTNLVNDAPSRPWSLEAEVKRDKSEIAAIDPALLLREHELGGLLASWQTIGGCGAGAGAGGGAGVKWIGRNVTGGLFNVQEQVLYSKLGTPDYPEHNFFFNSLISTDLGEKWNVGVNLPLVYKYFIDPEHRAPSTPGLDYTNAGLGDIGLQATRKLGSINDTMVTGIVGLPTGVYDATFTPGVPNARAINQNQQIGFGRPTATLVVDHVLDQVWGTVVVGGVAAYRGGKNRLDSYRAANASVYGYSGYFLGPFVPAFGLSLTGAKDHDRDQNSEQNTPLVSLAANVSIEWSTQWFALLLAGSLPYKYDGVTKDDSGVPRSPWGFAPWSVAFGVAASPF